VHLGDGSAAPRRLDTASSALAYGNTFGHHPDVSGMSDFCRMLQKLCVPPADFNPATSCVCNGRWRKERDDDFDGEDRRRRLQASELRGPARRLSEAPGIWRGTQGAYCGTWDPEVDQAEWCFVSPDQECALDGKQQYRSEAGQIMTKSWGPCADSSDEVDSRSQFVLDGLGALGWPLELSAVLGVLLLILSGCGVLLYRVPSTRTAWTPVKVSDDPDEAELPTTVKPPQWEELSLEQRFELAQREVMRLIDDATPDEQKFMFYGLYKQAKEGDVTSSRPGFFNHRERAKWDAWAEHRGKSPEEAIEGYIQAVALLRK